VDSVIHPQRNWPQVRRKWRSLPSVIIDQSPRHDHYHHIVGSDLVKGPVLCVHKIRVRHPDAIHHKVAEKHGFVEPVIQAFIFPSLAKKDVQAEVLLGKEITKGFQGSTP